MKIHAIALGVAAAAVAGCMQHVFVPTENATARLPDSGLPAAYYEIPAGAPRGSVQVATLGTRKLKEQAAGDEERKVLLVRLVVTNNSDETWRFDPRRQVLTFATGPQATPSYVYGTRSTATAPFDIPARGRDTFDLAYDIPREGKPLDHVELAWAVDLPDQVASNRSDFRREEVEPPSYYAGPYYMSDFYGPPAWYYPYPWVGGGPAVIVREPVPGPARVPPSPPHMHAVPPAAPHVVPAPPPAPPPR